jgi:hypothetical protein
MADPLLLRRWPAVVVCVAAVVLGVLLILGALQLLTPALVLWALCLVCLVRAAARHRRRIAAIYALGALPLTAALALLMWLAIHG